MGGTKNIPVDVRIVTATHKNLQDAVNRGRFRLDLFYRLNVFPIHLPPLRERDGDIRTIARHFLIKANQEYQRHVVLAAGVMERLESYNWPGNIRQLENVIKRAVLSAVDGSIRVADVENILRQESAINEHLEAGQTVRLSQPGLPPSAPPQTGSGHPMPACATSGRPYSWVREDELEAMNDALRRTHGNKTRAAALLGMSARQFRYRLTKLAALA